MPAAAVMAGLLALLPAGGARAEDFAEAAGRGTLGAFIFALTAGFLTSLTPCVYPMVPITMGVFGGRGGVSRARAMVLATLYVAGIAVMFGTLGTSFALLGKAFGTFLGNPWVVVPLAIFFFIMAASMFGAFELALPAGLRERLARVGGRGYLGAFLMGLVGGIIAAPCTGPPLAGILAYVATTRDGVLGFLLLCTYAAGIGVPFWAIAGFSLRLPRGGPWMDGVKTVFGIALAVAGLYYLRVVVPPLAAPTVRSPWFLAGAVATGLLGLVLGTLHLSYPGTARVRVRSGTARVRARKAAGIVLAVCGAFGTLNYALTPRILLHWMYDEPAAVARARLEGKPLVVDFTADWCLPCKEMDVAVFAHPDVAAELDRFVLVKVDLTREDESDTLPALKERYGVDTLPAVRFVAPGGQLVGRVDRLLPWQDFLGALRSARAAFDSRR